MALPDEVRDTYYDKSCDVCEDIIGADDEEYECKRCHKTICEECLNHYECHVCNEEDDDAWEASDDVCVNCLLRCKACNVKFHSGKCQAEHQKHCNPKSRAERAFASAKKAVGEAQLALAEAEEELEAASSEMDRVNATSSQKRKRNWTYSWT